MSKIQCVFQRRIPGLLSIIVAVMACSTSHAALTVIGTQYRMDQLFPEFNCYYGSGNYRTSCSTFQPGATVHVYVKNTGGSAETITDAILAGYSLDTVIKMSLGNYNPDMLCTLCL
jgi:hypothetical protein